MEEGETGFIVKEAVLFNAKGDARFGFLPYGTATAAYAAPSLSMPAIESRHDAAGRAILTINPPDKDGLVTQAGVEYLPLGKKVIDENGIFKIFFQDGLERLAAVHEQNNGETYITSYVYDPTGELTRITDGLNNLKTFAYDGLSRKTAMNDPDRGRMEYIYDDAGNLIRTIDNKGQEIVYTYDGANRLLTEDYLDAAGLVPDISYFYDEPSPDYPDALNLKGRLSRVQDLSGAEFFSYTERGNTKRTDKRISINGTDTNYRTAFTHDAMDRIVSMIYPDGEQVNYVYNNRTLLDSIPGYIENIDYHVSGGIKSIAYANGVSSTYAFDPRQRLTDLDTVSSLQSNVVVQNLGYTMDGVSNITAIADRRALAPDSPKSGTQSFQYDDLYRLTHADGPGYGAINFQYDAIGNMISKKSPDLPDPQHIDDPLINLGIMSYGGSAGTGGRGLKMPGDQPGPHAITATGSGLVYDYDDNGNMTSHASGDIYTWDFKDRLVRAQMNAAETEYIYDYSGQRVIKRVNEGGPEKAAFYISNTFEIRENKAVKHVFADSRRVAQIETDASGLRPPTQTFAFQPGWNFFSLTVEPDNPAIEAVLASISGSYSEVWRFDATIQQYMGYVPSEAIADLSELHAREGYIIRVTAPATLTVTGSPAAGNITLAAGWNLVPLPVDANASVAEALASIAGQYEALWGYDTPSGKWQDYLPDEQVFLNNLDMVQPVTAYWIKMQEPAELSRQQLLTKHFYHPDHLGSSNVVTDAAGAVVENTEFYPFGRPRYEERNGFDSAYKYTGKELDKESGLMYFEARYLDAVTGRFVSVDPLAAAPPMAALLNPQFIHPYGYAGNNPIIYLDPDGRGIKSQIKALMSKDPQIVQDPGPAKNYREPAPPVNVPGFLFRADARQPQEIFKQGFQPRLKGEIKPYTVISHVQGIDKRYLVSTTPDLLSTARFGLGNQTGQSFYLISGAKVEGPREVDRYFESLGLKNTYESDREIAVTGVSPEGIIAALEYKEGTATLHFTAAKPEFQHIKKVLETFKPLIELLPLKGPVQLKGPESQSD